MEKEKVCVGGKGTSEKTGKSAKSSSFIVGSQKITSKLESQEIIVIIRILLCCVGRYKCQNKKIKQLKIVVSEE